ncbi:MAG TPA: DUF2550 domain-containing protein [Streptosporangiaceae bacterium]
MAVGGSTAVDAGWLVAIILVLLVLAALAVAVRRALLERGGGTVECGLRRHGQDSPWRLGLASYQPDELRWHQVFGVFMRPDEIFPRRTLTVVSRRAPDAVEAASLGPGLIVVECRAGDEAEPMELAMSESALTGFLSWLESAPPGPRVVLLRSAGLRLVLSPSVEVSINFFFI